MKYDAPAATSVTPVPPPKIVSVVPLTIISVPALLSDRVTPLGVTVLVCPFSSSIVPSTVVTSEKALVNVAPFFTWNVPPMKYDVPAATSVTPVPPPKIVSVVPLTIISVPALLSDGTVITSPALFSCNVANALFVNAPLTFTVLLPPVKPVSNVPAFVTLPVIVTVDPLFTSNLPPLLFKLPLSVNLVGVAISRANRNWPPLLIVSVPPLGVTVLVCPSTYSIVPSTVVTSA